MKTLLFVLFITFSTTLVFAQTDKKQLEPILKNTQGVEKVDKEINEAMRDKEPSVFKLLLTDDFSNISSNGRLLNKKTYIADVKTLTIDSLNARDVEIRLYEDAAIAIGSLSILYQNGSSGYYLYTRVYIWNKDKWQMASAQYTVQNKQINLYQNF